MADVSHRVRAYTAERDAQAVPSVPWRVFGARDTIHALDFTGRQIAVLFVVLAAITSIPILLHPWPPLSDYINHLSRMYVIASIGSDANLARFYQVDWQVIPNLMMDLLVPLLERIMNVFAAGQVYTIASFVLILSGTLTFNRRLFGHWSILPLIAFPLLYNNVFLVGTMNYIFGIGLSLWALVTWVWLRERNLLLRLAASAVFVLALFFCHLFSVGLYGLGLLAFELHRLLLIYGRRGRTELTDCVGRPSFKPILDFIAAGLPFLPVLPLLMMSPTWGLRGSFDWEFHGKLDMLFYVFRVYSYLVAFVLIGILGIAATWAIRYRALQFHTFGWVLLAVAAITYLAMPRILFETYMADQRLPISIAFMVIACAHLNLQHDYVRRGFATVLVLLLAIRVFEVQTVWSELARPMKSFGESVRYIERGSKVLVAYADPKAGDDLKDLGLVHAACLAIIERSALVTTAFTVVGKQIMHVREDYLARVDDDDGTPPTVNQLLDVLDNPKLGEENYWANWKTDYDYVYALFTYPNFENPDPARLSAIYAGDRFVLHRIRPRPGSEQPEDRPQAPAVGESRPQVASAGANSLRVVDTMAPLPRMADDAAPLSPE